MRSRTATHLKALEDIIDASFITNLMEIFSSAKTFVEKANAVGLDPENDFQHADLSSVNFSNCDLRGYNFYGSNLNGCFGQNIRIDETTIIDSATTENSCFSFESKRRRIVKENPDFLEKSNSLIKEYWAKQIVWADEAITKKKENIDKALHYAHRILLSSNDKVVKKEILIRLRGAFSSAIEHRDFMMDLASRNNSDLDLKDRAIETLISIYYNHQSVFYFGISLLESGINDKKLESIIISKLLLSKFYSDNRILLLNYAKKHQNTRQLFLYYEVSRNNKIAVDYIIDYSSNRIIDFNDTVTDEKIVRTAYHILFKNYGRSGDRYAMITSASTIAVEIYNYFSQLKMKGIPFTIKASVENIIELSHK